MKTTRKHFTSRSADVKHFDDSTAGGMPRRDFIKTSAAAAGVIGAALTAVHAVAAQSAEAAQSAADNGRMKIGINLEYVRHADKSLAYGIKTASQMGYQWVEPCFLMGRCLLSNAGYCHVTSLDTDPKEILDLCAQAGVKISGLSSHSDLLNPEWGVLSVECGTEDEAKRSLTHLTKVLEAENA